MSEINNIEKIDDLVIGDYYKYGDNMVKITSINKQTLEITFDIINENQIESAINTLKQSNVTLNKDKYNDIIDFSNKLLEYQNKYTEQKGGRPRRQGSPPGGYPTPPPGGYPTPPPGYYPTPPPGYYPTPPPGYYPTPPPYPTPRPIPTSRPYPTPPTTPPPNLPSGIRSKPNPYYPGSSFYYQNNQDSYSGYVSLNNWLGYFKFINNNIGTNNYTLYSVLNKTHKDTININDLCNLYKNNFNNQEIYECAPEQNNIKNYDINLLKFSVDCMKEISNKQIYYYKTTDIFNIDNNNNKSLFNILNSNPTILYWFVNISISKTFYIERDSSNNIINIYNPWNDNIEPNVDINTLDIKTFSSNPNIIDCKNAIMCFGVEKENGISSIDDKILNINKKYKDKYITDLKTSIISSNIENESKNYLSTLYDTVILNQISVLNIINLKNIIDENNPLKIKEINDFCAKKLPTFNNTIKKEIDDLIASLKLQKTTPDPSLKAIPKKFVPRSDMNRLIEPNAVINKNLSNILDKKDVALKLEYNNSSDPKSEFNIYKVQPISGGFKKYINDYKHNKKSSKIFKKSKVQKNNMILKIIN